MICNQYSLLVEWYRASSIHCYPQAHHHFRHAQHIFLCISWIIFAAALKPCLSFWNPCKCSQLLALLALPLLCVEIWSAYQGMESKICLCIVYRVRFLGLRGPLREPLMSIIHPPIPRQKSRSPLQPCFFIAWSLTTHQTIYFLTQIMITKSWSQNMITNNPLNHIFSDTRYPQTPNHDNDNDKYTHEDKNTRSSKKKVLMYKCLNPLCVCIQAEMPFGLWHRMSTWRQRQRNKA